MVTQRPGVTVSELRDEFDMTAPRLWQIITRLELAGTIRREAER